MLLLDHHSIHAKKKKYLLIVICMYSHVFDLSNAQFNIPTPTPDRSEDLVPCHVPTGKASFCVPVARCKQLNALVTNLQKPIPGDVALYIKDSFFCTSSRNTVCCPFNGIINPKPPRRPRIRDRDDTCSVQSGATGSCTVYFTCPPLLQLLSNLVRPFPSEIPSLMQRSLLCGRENVGGVSLPKVCCPKEAVDADGLKTTTPTPRPLTDKEKFTAHPNRGNLAPTCPNCPSCVATRIVGGKEAPLGEYPWLVLLGYTLRPTGNPQWKCGGALIGDQYVLTAAHCVTDLPGSFQLSKIRLGEHKLSKDGIDCAPACKTCNHVVCNLGHQDIDIDKVIVHPSYNSPNIYQNDIALVKLKEKINPNKFVVPICLPYGDKVKQDYGRSNGKPTNNTFWVAGWGATDPRGRVTADSLQHLNLKIFDGPTCREVYKKRGGVLSEESQLCAGGEPEKDSCVGDSGSALMTTEMIGPKEFDRWKLIGIVSFGPRLCGTNGVPGVYSRVRHYIPWILDNVGS